MMTTWQPGPPPQSLPENLWGDQWRFAQLPAVDLEYFIRGKNIRVLVAPKSRHPFELGLASTLPIPGVVIDGGRRSLPLVQWLQATQPVACYTISGPPNGLVLAAGECDRWIIATFTDAEVATAAQEFMSRQDQTQGLHFLLVQPDNTAITYTGLWLLQSPPTLKS